MKLSVSLFSSSTGASLSVNVSMLFGASRLSKDKVKSFSSSFWTVLIDNASAVSSTPLSTSVARSSKSKMNASSSSVISSLILSGRSGMTESVACASVSSDESKLKSKSLRSLRSLSSADTATSLSVLSILAVFRLSSSVISNDEVTGAVSVASDALILLSKSLSVRSKLSSTLSLVRLDS